MLLAPMAPGKRSAPSMRGFERMDKCACNAARIGSRWFLIYLLFAWSAAAQTFDISSLDQPVALTGMWKMHAGDDPRWAAPDFDDSTWSTHHGGPSANRKLPAA